MNSKHLKIMDYKLLQTPLYIQTIHCTKDSLIKKKDIPKVTIEVDGKIVEQVKSFQYLGALLTEDGRSESELTRRIAIAKSRFCNMKKIIAYKCIFIGFFSCENLQHFHLDAEEFFFFSSNVNSLCITKKHIKYGILFISMNQGAVI